MADQQPHTEAGIAPTPADAVTDPNMVPFDDAAGGPTADKDNVAKDAGEPGDETLDAQLGSLS